ncbi:MAG: SDR family oxidoreductase [Rhodospirillaceae bacterium]|jgi:NAD(P)-dependent dehydrogenase (short-subunit alcohol dehydrogenase family)|nr:SDR family oxidoreductase [Rhodospirillaceae bacterium]MBT5564463.1 SDR family oxidoreductase [Rhodospirillaceae bacterium]MBT6089753.1 SDR family oxidoreductase [Rhodospirillaceae bacterium]MBT6961965.1 SDR family oxidoreductase [Rhodospirillaceae bacterium]
MLRIVALSLTILLAHTAAAKTVLVTGSNRGLGLEFVTQYAAKGWHVIATSRSPDDDEDLQALAAANTNITIEQLDVADLEEVAALAAKYQGTPIDVLMNNAGLFGDRPRQTWGKLDRDLFRQVMDVNVFGPLKLSEAFASHVAASETKKIAVISSTAGSISSIRNPPGAPYYAISKAAVNMAMRGTAMRLKEQGIAVAIFMPGAVDTRMLREAVGLTQEEAEAATDYDYRRFQPLTTEESISQMIATLDALTLDRSGDFLNYDGSTIPW